MGRDTLKVTKYNVCSPPGAWGRERHAWIPAWAHCFFKDQQETTRTGGNQPSVIAAGGPSPKQLALFSKKGQPYEDEKQRHNVAKDRHRREKERVDSQPSSAQAFACPKYSRVCALRIGLYSHHRACQELTQTFPKSSSARNWQSWDREYPT